MDKFSFKEIDSESMQVILAEKWKPVKAGTAYDQTDIDGRDGSLYSTKGMIPVTKPLKAFLMDKRLIYDVAAWLYGDGYFQIGDRYTEARIYDQIEFEEYGIGKLQFSIPFIFDPFWYSVDNWISVTKTVTNNGNVPSTPVIKVTGTGNCTVTIGSVSLKFAFGTSQETVEIDCKEKNETRPDLVSIGWEYPTLQPGSNTISIYGSCTVQMKRIGRWNVG